VKCIVSVAVTHSEYFRYAGAVLLHPHVAFVDEFRDVFKAIAPV
jgi:hypothetical protein